MGGKRGKREGGEKREGLDVLACRQSRPYEHQAPTPGELVTGLLELRDRGERKEGRGKEHVSPDPYN